MEVEGAEPGLTGEVGEGRQRLRLVDQAAGAGHRFPAKHIRGRPIRAAAQTGAEASGFGLGAGLIEADVLPPGLREAQPGLQYTPVVRTP